MGLGRQWSIAGWWLLRARDFRGGQGQKRIPRWECRTSSSQRWRAGLPGQIGRVRWLGKIGTIGSHQWCASWFGRVSSLAFGHEAGEKLEFQARVLDKKGKNGCERIQRTKRINRGDIQPYYTFGFGESLHGDLTGAKIDDVCIGCQWCISLSLAEGKRGGFSTQLGESGSKWHQPDVLANSKMPARSTQCSYEVERPLDTVAGGAELCPYAMNYLLTSWTRNLHFCSHWWFAFGGKQGRHRGDLQQAFREVDAEKKWAFWCKFHCVRWEKLGVTWCKPRTWRCTTQKLNNSPLLWLSGMVLMKGVMENLMRLTVELDWGSDWASCKVTRKSTSSGLIFVNSCCVHSHSRAQMSVSLSSMGPEILAATSLLVENIQLKQLLQFLLGDAGGLNNNAQVQMRLRLDSASAQSFLIDLDLV